MNNPRFASSFDPVYDYYGVKVTLENGQEVELSHYDPLDMTYYWANSYSLATAKVSKDEPSGYYRYAAFGSFDVFLSVSFSRIGKDRYEIGADYEFIIAPVTDSFGVAVQYSEDGTFGNPIDKKLTLSTQSLYYMADMIDWGRWEE